MIDPSTNRFCKLLGLAIPIMQAPTASIAGPELASAVSNAGALGSMGLTWAGDENAVRAIDATREATQRPFAANFALSFQPEALPAVLDAGAPIITFSWGDPTPYADTVRAAGALFGVQVGHPDGAKSALDSGAGFIICQGVEAGGHVQSTLQRDSLLESLLHVSGGAVVIAAGGLAVGRDIARVLKLGADGAMLGTRFVATRESRAHPEYKRMVTEAASGRTVLTICFDVGWPNAPQRVLRNGTLDRWESAGCPPPGRRPGEGQVIAHSASGEPILRYEDTAPMAGMDGSIAEMCLYAGEGVGRIADIPSAGDLVRRLWAETLSELAGDSS